MNESEFRRAERALWDRYVEGGHARVRERFVDVTCDAERVRVRVQEIGDVTDEPVVFIAGSPNAASTFAPLAGPLVGCRRVLVDRPGTGLSDAWPSTNDPAKLRARCVAVLDAVLDALALERAHLCGSSIGGWWAFVYAAARTHRVDRVLQCGVPAGMPGEQLPWGVRMLGLPGMSALMTAMKPTPASVKMVFGMIGHRRALAAGAIAPELLDWYLALVPHTDTNAHDVAADARVISFFAPQMRALAIARDALVPLAPHTHFLWGTNDSFGGADVARALVATLPGASLELVDGGGHLPWLDDPARAVAWALAALHGAATSARAA